MADQIGGASGNATAADLLSGYTASVDSGPIAGTMPNEGAVVLTPSGTGNVGIPAGYHDGSGYVSQVNVPAASVLNTATIAGVTGTIPVITSGNQLNPSTTQVNGPTGYYDSAHEPFVPAEPNLVPGNILNGVSVYGVVGTVIAGSPYASGTGTSSGSLISFTTNNSGTQSYAYITVGGLSFQPSRIIVEISGLETDVYDASGPWFSGSATYPYNCFWWSAGAPHYIAIEITGNAYINSSGFQLPVIAGTALSVTWRAYQD